MGCRAPFCELGHAGHRGSMDLAAKGCTDDLKSLKSNRGVKRPTSHKTSITNQRRMYWVSFRCWKRHSAQQLKGLRGMAFSLSLWTFLGRLVSIIHTVHDC